MKHTKLPWSWEQTEKNPNNLDVLISYQTDSEDNKSWVSWAYNESNAALIVKAVNNHEKLLNTLKKARPAVLWRETHLSVELDDLVKEIDEAIKEAECQS